MKPVPTSPAAFGARRHPIVQENDGWRHWSQYGPWRIYYDPPPIPIRTMDWHFLHDNYDASYEGAEDGWVSNGLAGSCASFADALNECDALEDEVPPPPALSAPQDRGASQEDGRP